MPVFELKVIRRARVAQTFHIPATTLDEARRKYDETEDGDHLVTEEVTNYTDDGPILESITELPIPLSERRTAAADEAYENQDFGSVVEAANGWEYTEPGGREWVRTVFVQDEANVEGPTIALRYVVTFAPGTDTITDRYFYRK
jgi:hypothetical protein